MRSSTSSSEVRFIAAFAMTFIVLAVSWEAVLRQRAGATLEFAIGRPAVAAPGADGERWVVFGNCLMMTGVSPRRMNEQLGEGKARVITNIAAHEQSPIAFFDYLRRTGQYPDVVITNVSSWLNGTNFEQESDLVAKADPLGLLQKAQASAPEPEKAREQAYRQDGDLGTGRFQKHVEEKLAREASTHVQSFGHRYHLFDYLLFVGTLATTANLDNALYQLNMQSWFRVTSNETDGQGYVGLKVQYRDDWSLGLERMADRSLQRMRLSRLLTPRYWALLEENAKEFKSHGTQVVFVRMPEHPKIREFNDKTYEIPEKLRAIEERTGSPVLDLSRMGPAEGIHLFDAVHPDAASAEIITREIASWLRSRHVTTGRTKAPDHAGGG